MILGTWLVENHALTIGQPPWRSIIKIDDLLLAATLFDPCDLRESASGSASVPVGRSRPRRPVPSGGLLGRQVGFKPAGAVGQSDGADNRSDVEFGEDAPDLGADRIEGHVARLRHLFG